MSVVPRYHPGGPLPTTSQKLAETRDTALSMFGVAPGLRPGTVTQLS